MTEIPTLEIASLNVLHPQLDLEGACAVQLMIRLGFDPARISGEVARRAVRIEHRSKLAPSQTNDLSAFVSWQGLDVDFEAQCRRFMRTVPEDAITEWAAIGMMGLLISHLEGGRLGTVLQKGKGADYEVVLEPEGLTYQVEISGIHADPTINGSLTAARLGQKAEQLLRYAITGFVSVSTFAHSATPEVRSVLHFVERQQLTRIKKRMKRGR